MKCFFSKNGGNKNMGIENKNKVILVLVGVSGSGKTTLAKRIGKWGSKLVTTNYTTKRRWPK